MKTPNPMPALREILLDRMGFVVTAPIRARKYPRVIVQRIKNRTVLTFALSRLVEGQTFLGFYPSAANLPTADNLKVGDYALLASGEIVQIGQ